MRRLRLPLLCALLVAAFAQPVVAHPDEVVHSDNFNFVATVRYPDDKRGADSVLVGPRLDTQGGTDVEFATLTIPDVAGLPAGVEAGQQRDFAFAGTYRNGLQIMDITDPTAPQLLTTYDCNLLQGDTQVFTRDGRTYVTYTNDTNGGRDSACFRDAGTKIKQGIFVIEVTNPYAPKAVGFVAIPRGSHNATVHPGGQYLYNSNSEGNQGGIEVVDLSDVTKPRVIETVPLGAGEDSHDVTFNAAGTRAYSAALDHSVILDTTDPAKPTVISRIDDAAITLHHQADPVTIGERTFLIINDELAGAAGNGVCPGGGLHVYDITGDLERAPRKVGAFFIPDVNVQEGADTGIVPVTTCTSHVFRIYEEQQLLTIAWFAAGVRVIDLSDLDGYSVGVTPDTGSLTPGMREIAYHRFVADSDAWSAKIHRFEADGSAYVFSNDQTRGFDVLFYDASAEESAETGTWMTPQQARARALSTPAAAHAHADSHH
jgi:hypothetical protein